MVVARWFENVATTYELTQDRLILHKGIFNKSRDEIELCRVKDVRVEFSPTAQWAVISTIVLESSDETTAQVSHWPCTTSSGLRRATRNRANW